MWWINLNLWLFRLTIRNWGATWHALIVALSGVIYIRILNIESLESNALRIGTYVLIMIMIIYELWQLKYNDQSIRGAIEDIVMNIFGYIIAIIPLIH